MVTFLVFIIILGFLILVHELGHFISARKLGVDVEEFAIGFPPKIFSVKRNGIDYSINWIPIGGYVKIKGESGDHQDDPNSFVNKSAWRRIFIVSAGVLMNFIVAFVLMAIVLFIGFPQEIGPDIPMDRIRDREITIMEVMKKSPAMDAGIEVGDNIVSINGEEFKNKEEVYKKLEALSGSEVSFLLERNDQEIEYQVRHRELVEDGPPMIGIGISETAIVNYGFFESIWNGLKITISMIGRIVEALYQLIANLISKGKVSGEFGGPVAVAVVTGTIVKLGFVHVLYFAAVLSINLGVINFFPFPALDGGRVLFIAAQAITGKKLNEKVEAWIHNSGFILLILLLVFITFRDFQKYGSMIWRTITSWFA